MNSHESVHITGHDVGIQRGGRKVLENVEFQIGPGDVLLVTGRNGAGKSTLLRAVAGLLAIETGKIEFLGAEPALALHLVGHQNAIKPRQTLFENALFWARWQGHGDASDERAEAALEAVGLWPLLDTPAEFLSQGQRRRLALSRLLASPRPVWLLDEPTAGLDDASRRTFATLMTQHTAAGGLIMAATHDALDVERPRRLELGA
ncbi:MAG: heme ABC exporter ATP-binding protein CcmA [Pseudomonadota bacterium]